MNSLLTTIAMHDPLRMVFVSIISTLVLCTGLFIYKYIYPKRNINLLTLLILLSLLPLVSLLRPGDYESGDFNIHLFRTIEFYRSLTEGNFLPSWAGGLNMTYGYPVFIFNYPLPYYLISLFLLLGFSFISSMKLFLATSYLLSGIFMYVATKKLFKNDVAAFTAAIFYQFAPYHLIDLHFRVTIGEVLMFALLPLLFYSLQKLWDKKMIVVLFLTGIVIALLIGTHVVLALFTMLLLLAYSTFIAYTLRKKFIVLWTIISFSIGSLASLYIWLTPFFLSKYTILPAMQKLIQFDYFPTIWDLLYSPYRYGFLFQGHHGELSFLIGYTHLLIIISICLLFFYKKIKKSQKAHIVFWLTSFFIILFLISEYSKFIWGAVPFLKITGGSQRLLLLIAFIISILAGYVSTYLYKKKRLFWILIAVTIFLTILNWGHRRVIPEIQDAYLIENAHTENNHFYANSKWRTNENPWFKNVPKYHLQVVTGESEIKELQRNSTTHTYIVNAKSNVSFYENTLYFPGWYAIDNGSIITLQPDKEGRISFHLNKGLHYVEIKYEDIQIYKILKLVSILILLGITIYLIIYSVAKIGRKRKLFRKP